MRRERTLRATTQESPERKRQARLVAHLDGDRPFLSLDGEPVPTFSEVATHYVARLIAMDGEPKSFRAFVRENHPRFDGTVVTRVWRMSRRSSPVHQRGGPGSSPRLKVEDLQ